MRTHSGIFIFLTIKSWIGALNKRLRCDYDYWDNYFCSSTSRASFQNSIHKDLVGNIVDHSAFLFMRDQVEFFASNLIES